MVSAHTLTSLILSMTTFWLTKLLDLSPSNLSHPKKQKSDCIKPPSFFVGRKTNGSRGCFLIHWFLYLGIIRGISPVWRIRFPNTILTNANINCQVSEILAEKTHATMIDILKHVRQRFGTFII